MQMIRWGTSSLPDLVSLAKPPVTAPRPAWKEEAWQRTQEELRQLAVDVRTKAVVGSLAHPGKMSQRQKGEATMGRHAHTQLCIRVGLDQEPPPRPAGHKPTTGEPERPFPLWGGNGTAPKYGVSSSKQQRLPSEPRGPLWKLTKARPHGPPNLAGGHDGTSVRWDW
eukprot:TRINITY_DN7205_c0_g1_i1.p1 TRINITY_DN7205_c0_g1~~TRINITY_DN7205_c0_g1_i1.p1  ORF type:complete len:167 (+),score=29.12 TRINITY_DN7205_c0_g1_i1:28-528(+)